MSGQILETHLGWACANLGREVGELVEEYRRTGQKRQELLDLLKDIYSEQEYTQLIEPMNNEQLMELADNLKKGIPIATRCSTAACPTSRAC